MFFLLGMLLHMAAIASLFPEVAAKTTALADLVVVSQFVLMALALVAHQVWNDEDDVLRSRLARASLTLGITYVCLLIFVTFGISVGPADPFGAPASATLAVRAGWFIGFSLIASLGSRFFIAKPLLEIASVLGGAMRSAPARWYGLGLGLGLGFGGAVVALMHSELVLHTAAEAQATMDKNPAPYVIGFLVLPMLLGGIARALRGSRGSAR
jgi:hypothetical protein